MWQLILLAMVVLVRLCWLVTDDHQDNMTLGETKLKRWTLLLLLLMMINAPRARPWRHRYSSSSLNKIVTVTVTVTKSFFLFCHWLSFFPLSAASHSVISGSLGLLCRANKWANPLFLSFPSSSLLFFVASTFCQPQKTASIDFTFISQHS